jgi:hypothetical protein
VTEIERIARLLCESDGFSSDENVFPVAYELAIGAQGKKVVPYEDPVPQWTLYVNYVKAILTEVRNACIRRGELCVAIDDILAGAEKAEPPPVEPLLFDEPAPDWRERYHLRGRVGLPPK